MARIDPTATPPRFRWACGLVATLVLLVALYFVVAGVRLVTLGGSFYFALAGLALAVAGVLLWRGRVAGAWLYAATFVASAAWAVADAGWTFWPLFSRLFALGAIGLLVALVSPALPTVRGRSALAVAAVMAVGLAAAFAGMFVPHPTVAAAGGGPGLTPVDPAARRRSGRTTATPRAAAASPHWARSTGATSAS